MGCIFVSLETITAGESSILTFINPLLVIIFGTIFLKLVYRRLQWIGVILGFLGVFITFGAHLSIKVGTILGFLSAVSWAIGTLLIKTWGQKMDVWVLTAYQMLFGGLVLFLSSFILEKPFFEVTATSIFILLWLAIMASIVQFAVWFYLLISATREKQCFSLFSPVFRSAFRMDFIARADSLVCHVRGSFYFHRNFSCELDPKNRILINI